MGSVRVARFVAVVVSFAVVGLMVGAAEAEVSDVDRLDGERHCVVTVADVVKGGKSAPSEQTEVCFKTEKLAEAHVASLTGGGSSLTSTGGSSLTSLSMSGGSNVIGKHYTSTSFSGSTVTVVGTTCGGGVWWPTGFWNNNLESSGHYCGSSPTTFYDSSNCSTGSKLIFSAATTLGSMNNKASCVRYG